MNLFPKELFIFCRTLGIFPVKNIGAEHIEKLKFSVVAFVYSLALVASQAVFSFYSFVWDLRQFKSSPMRYQSGTAVLVMFCDILSLSVTAVVCVLGSGLACGRLVDLYRDLQRFDELLQTRLDQGSVRRWLFVSCACLTSMLVLDFTTFSLIRSMSPVYLSVLSLHYTSLAVQLQYVSVVDSLRRRFRLLNQRICQEVTRNRLKDVIKLATLPAVDNVPDHGTTTSESVSINSLSDMHWFLTGAIHRTNGVFAWQLLAHMVSLFLHIIIAPYFFFFSLDVYTQGLVSPRYLVPLGVQVLWVIVHAAKLILLVWPCAATTDEARQTAPIVCKLLSREMSPKMRKQLENLVLQLLHHNAEFSAFGLFPLQFPILTSIAGAVTTYLVILIQFQNAATVDLEETLDVQTLNISAGNK